MSIPESLVFVQSWYPGDRSVAWLVLVASAVAVVSAAALVAARWLSRQAALRHSVLFAALCCCAGDARACGGVGEVAGHADRGAPSVCSHIRNACGDFAGAAFGRGHPAVRG